ncbi:DNA gyrase subunit A [Thermotomaculum hydrothermale]|uniref:DNA gyrase subunit A n=1 Tax=Thermotomaculum hydrothermale TaxID=981385 RepID=A0A7R6T097_9BACT|nr:DNA gyrase subunit A [Thermotomaculum hydrothermale]BBB33497.1 DNA gyrase subunit A [Thermotomaculum hydrothermale]
MPEDIRKIEIEEEVKKSYLDYAMSVIVGRAIPDVRDGLKPVHRRILYSMYDMKNDYNKPYKKSARIVGDVIGKYHPHGDSAVYDAIVRMAQDFSLRYPLVDGQGNFGSVDGDSAAAMRYTEIRMAKIAHELLKDIEKETVPFQPNYDGSLNEPVVLPARIPNLLVNGSSGIAVGMATSIPPHNLNEVIDGIIALIENPNITVKELMQHVKGPDFPTGGIIYGMSGIKKAYEEGRGRVVIRGKVNIEKVKGDRDRIIISEIPYQVNKANLITKIADLVRNKQIEGIADIRDESDRDGIRVVIELKKGVIPQVVLNHLYKHTQLQSSFSIIFLSLVNLQPKVLNLKGMLEEFVSFRKEVVINRTRYELRKARERAHILEGLKIAIENIDEVIAIIKKSKNPSLAKENLIKRFNFSEKQAQAILDMKLQRLTGLEREKILEEYRNILKLIADLEDILKSEKRVYSIIKDELLAIKEEYGDPRRTQIIPDEQEFSIEDFIQEEDVVITVSGEGYIKRTPITSYRKQRRGGKGIRGTSTKEEDFIEHVFIASTHQTLLIFTTKGKCHWLKVYDIPEYGTGARGRSIANLLQLESDEKVAAYVSLKELDLEDKYIVFATEKGLVKKTPVSAFSNPRKSGIIAITLREGDTLISAKVSGGDDLVFIATRNGMSIKFNEKDVRPMGRAASGVKGINLRKGDIVVSMDIVSDDNDVLTISEFGYGKRTSIKDYRLQSRGGTGIINMKVTEKTGKVVKVLTVDDNDEIVIMTIEGKAIRVKVSGISRIGRNTQGVRLLALNGNDVVTGAAKIARNELD